MIASRPLVKPLSGVEKALIALLGCLAFFVMELVGGSGYEYSALAAAYLGMVILAIRSVGGMSSMFGAIILWYASQHVLVSQVTKLFFGQSPDSRLNMPVETMLSEGLLMLGFCLAGVVGNWIKPNRDRALFPPIVDVDVLHRVAAASTLFALIRMLTQNILGAAAAGPLRMLGIFDSLAVVAAVAAAVTASGGKRLMNPIAWTTVLVIMFFGFVGGGRQSFVSAGMSVVLGGWAFGYRFKPSYYVGAIVASLLMFFIVSPYSLAVRSAGRTADIVKNTNIAIDLFIDVVEHPGKYQVLSTAELQRYELNKYKADYFAIRPGNASNILNRYGLIKLNDMIVEDTIKTGTTGWANVTPGLPRLLPEFLSPQKSLIYANGNSLMHRVDGVVGVEDVTTGITVGLTADVFSAFAWKGMILLPFGLMLLNVVAHKLIFRLEMRRNIFALAAVVPTAHTFSEGTILTYLSTAVYTAPLFGFGFYLAMRSAGLFDFRYLRPRGRTERSADDVAVA